MQPLVVGLNIKNAPVEMLEALSIHHSVNKLRLDELAALAGARSVLILSTCNRLELYAVSDDPERSTAAMRDFLACQDRTSRHYEEHRAKMGIVATDEGEKQVSVEEQQPYQGEKKKQLLHEYIYDYTGEEAVRHLYRVVSGLDSMVLGETEILGQVARAYEHALSAGATDKILNRWFQRALSVGKLVRTQFGMDQYHTSVGRIAVDLAEQELGCLENKHILILGAGEMCELTMKHLISKTCSLVMVSNRSLPKAQELAAAYGFEACSLDELPCYLKQSDLVFSATAAKHYLISYDLIKDAMAVRGERPLVFIDMAVPRDIDPRAAELAGVSCFDIKQLKDVSDKNYGQRKQAALLVEKLIDEKVEEFFEWLTSLDTLPVSDRQQEGEVSKRKRSRALAKLAKLSRAGVL